MLKEKVLSYTVFFAPAPEGGHTVHVPALAGVTTQRENLPDAKKMAVDAIQSYISVTKEDGEDIPVESKGAVVDRVSAKII